MKITKTNLKQLACQAFYALALVFVLPISTALSDEASDVTENLEKVLLERFDQLEISDISPSPIAGMYEVVASGQIYYVSEDGDYLLHGALIETKTRTDLTAVQQGKIQFDLINQVDESAMLVYEPTQEVRSTITVFTDTSCPYCSKLHAEIDELLNEGIRVRYIMYPRAGVGSAAHQQLESVWCADDPHAAMTVAKQGGTVEPATCTNPIESNIDLARSAGITGTPSIHLDDGTAIPGFQPAEALIAILDDIEN